MKRFSEITISLLNARRGNVKGRKNLLKQVGQLRESVSTNCDIVLLLRD